MIAVWVRIAIAVGRQAQGAMHLYSGALRSIENTRQAFSLLLQPANFAFDHLKELQPIHAGEGACGVDGFRLRADRWAGYGER